MLQKTILIVDDHDESRQLLIYCLGRLGTYGFREASDGYAALACLAQDPPDLIILDLKMPQLDGWETARRIRALPGPAQRIPILALTARALQGDKEKALAAGCDAYIAKPVRSMVALHDIVEQLLAQTAGRAYC